MLWLLNKTKGFVFVLLAALTVAPAEWQVARPGWKYLFPRDHGSHPDFKTEWCYFTGNLTAEDGRKFGYQLTFFRQGMMSNDEDIIPLSRFVTRDVKFAHFTITDLSSKKFHFFQKLSRGAYGEAGFEALSRLAWIENWSCELTGENSFHLQAAAEDASLDLRLNSAKPVVFHGKNGLSQKAEGEGRASHYYSLTRLNSEGTLTIGKETYAVNGLSWFDHEWSTNQLEESQSGWDWFSLQFDDGSELMLFQIRTKGGGRDPFSSGTFVDAKGVASTITTADFTLEPGKTWRSPESGAEYPMAWRLAVPRLNLDLEVNAALSDQELRLKPIIYWEGVVSATGTASGQAIKGSGYLEMTGYAGPLVGLKPAR